MCSKGCVCVLLVWAVCVCMCTVLGWRLCKCTNLAGFAGSWITAPALLAGRAHLKEQQGEYTILSFPLFFLHCCSISAFRSVSVSLGWEMAAAQIGKSCGRFGKRLFSLSHFLSPITLCCYRLVRGHIQDEKQVSQEKCESLYAFSWYQHQLALLPSSLHPLFSLCSLHFCILSLSLLSL